MEPTFWHRKWEKNEIAFHENQTNPILLNHFSALSLSANARIFVPLCGKTLDIHWLLGKGYKIAGVELSHLAIEQLFDALKRVPTKTQNGTHVRYSADNIDIFVGDIFNLTESMLGVVDAVYDRAALVALPLTMRSTYAAHLIKTTHSAPQLLVCYTYDQSQLEGPPFSITQDETFLHYGHAYKLTLLETSHVPGGLKGQHTAWQNIWLLNSTPPASGIAMTVESAL